MYRLKYISLGKFLKLKLVKLIKSIIKTYSIIGLLIVLLIIGISKKLNNKISKLITY